MESKDKTVIGVAWYSRHQWPRLLQAAVDADALEATFDEWQTLATKLVAEMQATGTIVERVDVDVERLIFWCNVHQRALNADARAAYVSDVLRLRDLNGK